jgi:hypothetical protein
VSEKHPPDSVHVADRGREAREAHTTREREPLRLDALQVGPRYSLPRPPPRRCVVALEVTATHAPRTTKAEGLKSSIAMLAAQGHFATRVSMLESHVDREAGDVTTSGRGGPEEEDWRGASEWWRGRLRPAQLKARWKQVCES